MTIIYPRYSFVQPLPATDSCYADRSLFLPLSQPQNLAFQVLLEDVPFPAIDGINSIVAVAYPVPVDTVCSFIDGAATGQPYDGILRSSYVQSAIVSAGVVNMRVNFAAYPFADWDDYNAHTAGTIVNVGSCFKLAYGILYLNASNEIVYVQTMGCSCCFTRTDGSTCYTSVLKYRCGENSFDFRYTEDSTFLNAVELPFYLKEPSLSTDQKVYTKSNGEVVKLYDRKEEVYALESDYMPYLWLKNLDIALSHDVVGISNGTLTAYDPVNTAVHFAKTAPLEIAYSKFPTSTLGKATCKLTNVSAVHLLNNNCL